MGLGAMIHILIFIKIGSGIEKLIGGIHRHTDTTNTETHTAWRLRKSTFIF
jgi:hypothetical protein